MLDSIFASIFSSSVTPAAFFAMAAVTLLSGTLYAWLMSFCVRSNRRFFLVVALIPLVVAAVISFVNGSCGAGVAVGGAFGLIRFRSAPGSAEEIAAILGAMGAGIAFGMGYLAYGAVLLLLLALGSMLLARLDLFEHSVGVSEQLLRVTIPEALEYNGAFDDIFSRYLDRAESVGVKTTGMGSMFRLSYKVRMKNPQEEKAVLDALRTRNGNLEISLLPYTERQDQL